MITLGAFETVSLAEFKVSNVIAKVDTGAYSGALHCTDIKVVRRGILRHRILKFNPLGKPSLAAEVTKFQKTFVRSASGHRIKRYIIETTIDIRGETYPIKIGLSDRSDLKRPVLIGRRFLREQDMLIDVSINQEFDDKGEIIR